MAGWLDGWMDGGMDRWSDGGMDGQAKALGTYAATVKVLGMVLQMLMSIKL